MLSTAQNHPGSPIVGEIKVFLSLLQKVMARRLNCYQSVKCRLLHGVSRPGHIMVMNFLHLIT